MLDEFFAGLAKMIRAEKALHGTGHLGTEPGSTDKKKKKLLAKAVWTSAFISTLPDSSFGVVLPGGKKDSEGKTVPRSLRKFPFKDGGGKVDLPHLRNALSRLPQTTISSDAKATVRRKLEAAATTAKIGDRGSAEKGEFSQFGPVLKADDERQIVFMPVLLPFIEDAQEDISTEFDIEQAAHRFAKEYAAGEAQLGLDHVAGGELDREDAVLVETWIEKQDMEYEQPDGEVEFIPSGTWMIGVHIPNTEVWQSMKSGERTGASIEGYGMRTDL